MPKHKEISVSLPEALLGKLDLHFYDPASDKPEYGTRSRLITQLLDEWLRKQSRKTRHGRADRRNADRGPEARRPPT